jgi:PAS domain S-box-containing protein
MELSSAPILDDKGTINGLVIVFRDITKRTQIENELEEYRKQLEHIAKERTAKLKLFSDIVEKSPDGVLIIDLNGLILYANHSLEGIYGAPVEDLKGKHFNEMNSDPVFASEVIIPSIMKQGHWDGELQIRHVDGKSFPVWLAAFMVNDNNNRPTGIIGILRDLTERKKAEQTMKDSEEKFRTLFNQASDSIFLLSLSEKDRIIEDTNDAALTTYGYTREELIGKPISILGNAETQDGIPDMTDRLLKEDLLNFEASNVRRDGSTFPVEVSAQLIHIGEKPYVLVFSRDITERKQAEEKLMEYHEHLEELVRERTRMLTQANEDLQNGIIEKKKAERKLLEYQRQLQSLTSQLSLFEENEKRRIATELHDCVGQTLALSKIKLGLLNKAAPTAELKNNIQEILQLIEQTIKETRTLTFELSPPILYELGLSQAVQWLIDQFHEKHGLSIIYKNDGLEKPFDNNVRFFLFQAIRELLFNVVKHAKATKATITMASSSHDLQITVEDNGIGFTGPNNEYDGFGLFNIRERMNHIRGQFKIESNPIYGTKVSLVAPFEINKKKHEKELI